MGLKNKQNTLLLQLTYLQYHCCKVSCSQPYSPVLSTSDAQDEQMCHSVKLSSWCGLVEEADITHQTEMIQIKDILPAAHVPDYKEWDGFP